MATSERNFREFYGVEDSLNIGKWAATNSTSVRHAAVLAMSEESEYKGYVIKRTDNPEKILFGRFDSLAGTIPPESHNLLTLSMDDERIPSGELPAVSLRYGIYSDEIVIGYAQTHALLDTLEPYLEIKRELGARPHEFLVAQFLARIAPTLDNHPKTGVFVALHYVDKPVYPTLRDRFFDSNYSLNPKRERVRQILGEDNAWLQQSAVESRQQRLAQLVKGREQRPKPKAGLPDRDWRDLFI